MRMSLDYSNPQISLFISKAVADSVDAMLGNISSLCKEDLGTQLDFSLFLYEDPIFGSLDVEFREFTTPGMIALAISFFAMALTSESFISERSQGLLERAYIAGVLQIEILASSILSQFVVMVIQVRLML